MMEFYKVSYGQGFQCKSIGQVDEYMKNLGAIYYYDAQYPRPYNDRLFCRHYFISDQTEIGNYIPDMIAGQVFPEPRTWGIEKHLVKLF